MMDDPDRSLARSLPPNFDDFKWSPAGTFVELGIWAAPACIETGNSVELRVAIRNPSSAAVEVGDDFVLVLRHGEEVREYFGGPRSSAPIRLDPGEIQEIVGWRLDEDSGLKAGINKCHAIYRDKGGTEIRSTTVEIEVQLL
jgi:hypothetical protein